MCASRGIGIVTGGPYNSGILATGAVPGAFYNYDPASDSILKKVASIEEICRQYSTPLKAAALQFPLLHPTHLSVIPGGQNVEEMKSNFEAFHFEIPQGLWGSLKDAHLIHPDSVTG